MDKIVESTKKIIKTITNDYVLGAEECLDIIGIKARDDNDELRDISDILKDIQKVSENKPLPKNLALELQIANNKRINKKKQT